jgi:glycosyltransferase involved in cell wall biosynthesis
MKTVCIIPAYNEERTIGGVIETVKSVGLVDDIIVISDGSIDSTAKIAREMGVNIIELNINRGKGAALKAGIDNTNADILLFLDADLIGLNVEHVNSLIYPVLNNEVDMTVGLFESGRFLTDLAQKVAPNLSGQRALKKCLIQRVSNMDMTRYGIEVALTRIAEREHYNYKTVYLKDMTHIMKEEKLGFTRGFAERMKMYWQIMKCFRM